MSQKLLPLNHNGQRVDGYWFDPNTDIIYYFKSHEGKKIKFSTGVKLPKINLAKQKANAKLKKKLGLGKVRVSSLVRDEFPLWVKVKESEGLAPLTMKNIYRSERYIVGFWGDMFPHEINRDNLRDWYEWHQSEFPGQQLENSVKYLRNFCRYLAEKVVNDMPLLPAVPKITDPNRKELVAKRRKKKERIFTVDEFQKIYRAGNEIESLVCLFMYTMATRIDETLNLKFDEQIHLDLDTPEYRWSVGQNKADLWGSHALHPALIEPLKALKKQRDAEGTNLLFPQLKNNQKPLKPQQIDWKGIAKRADLGWHWSSHFFRHACLSNLFNDERNPQALICKLYRVSLEVAVDTYIKPTESGRMKMREAIEVKL